MKNPWINVQETHCHYCGKKIKIYFDRKMYPGTVSCEECIKNKAWENKAAP